VKKRIKILEFRVDQNSAVPVYKQIKEAVKFHIVSGTLITGDQLMSIRDMASKTNIHPNTIVKAYYQLEVEGYIEAKPGKGYFVKSNRKVFSVEKKKLFKTFMEEFIAKSTELGFSMENIYRELKKFENARKSVETEEKNDNNK